MAFIVGALAILLLTGCSQSAGGAAPGLPGRWERTASSGLGEPDLLLAEHLEFRKDGQVAVLLHDAGPNVFWTIGLDRYALPGKDTIELRGRCRKGYESFDCTRVYRMRVDGAMLRIRTQSGACLVTFRRIGGAGKALPPRLAPPQPTPATDGRQTTGRQGAS